MATTKPLISEDEFLGHFSDDQLRARIREVLKVPRGGCDACRFEDPFSERLCTIPDISAEDFDLGVHGIDCSRFQPREQSSEQSPDSRVDSASFSQGTSSEPTTVTSEPSGSRASGGSSTTFPFTTP